MHGVQDIRSFLAPSLPVAKWAHSDLSGYVEQLRTDLAVESRRAPFEIMSIPSNAPDDFLSDEGEVLLTRQDIQVVQLVPRG